ncbi:MAG: LamG domain-containing protein [bacterium]|nr:LamG domain-containing protein [bacterium]
MMLRLSLLLILSGLSFGAAPRADYCLDLDGASAGAQLQWNGGLQTLDGARQYTIEAWVRPRSQGGGGRGRIMDQQGSSFTFYLSDNGRLGLRPNREAGWQLSEENAVTFWKWQHVAVTYDGKLLRFFVEGKLLSATPVNGELNMTRKPVWIGNGLSEDSTYRGFDGWLDDLRVTAACRWKSNFKVPQRGEYIAPDPATVLYFTFDEGLAYSIALDYSTFNTELPINMPLRRVKSP